MSGVKRSSSDTITRQNRNSEMASDFNAMTIGQRRWWKIPRRYHVAIMCYLAFFIKGWMVTNLWTMFVHILLAAEEVRKRDFPKSENWTVEDLETHLDLNYWGGAVIQLPAALITICFSPHKIMLLSVLLASLLHMLTPFIIHGPAVGTYFFLFTQGMIAGPLACACVSIWKEWGPARERTSLLVLAFSGQIINVYVTFSLSMFLAEAVGPFSIYYFAGMAGVLWCFLWNTLIYESPTSDPLITIEEQCYLEENITPDMKEKINLKSIPWKSIFLSMPVISLCLVFFTVSFLKKVMMFTGILINVQLINKDYDPSFSHWVLTFNFVLLVPASGFLVDYLINREIFQRLTMRKFFCTGGFIMHALFLGFSYIPSDLSPIICYIISFIFLSMSLTGYLPTVLEISPRYASITIALCTSVSRLSAIVFDSILEKMKGEGSGYSIEHGDWKIVLIPCGILGLITAIIFGIFASSDEQPWSLMLLPSRRKTNDSEYYPKNEVENDSLVSENL
ncbi:vesicular glutamate transporter 2.1 [Parasteatoda tepidariorum]|uniref:vesicular glutamate transporter 2.1 n=1 Tax=Parasteatoda tepidariorum TaxID=114398 RepID=UPI00077FBC20|nr:vesicular glutamate transporter 2.1 [Parasteatoda tepidariorum]XP_015908000.1 vesicular glutamate transporter 2.1 [Parasteatoda tepidariorum]XP_015908001.1 vesicular glutamate transporter 2.1 [Parasteatoda tepidariorum]